MEWYHIVIFAIALVGIGTPVITLGMLSQSSAMKIKPGSALFGALALIFAQPVTVLTFIDLATVQQRETHDHTQFFYFTAMMVSMISLFLFGLFTSIWPYLPGVVFHSKGWKIGLRITLGILGPLLSLGLMGFVLLTYLLFMGLSPHAYEWSKSPDGEQYATLENPFNFTFNTKEIYIRNGRYTIWKKQVGTWHPGEGKETATGDYIPPDTQLFWTKDKSHIFIHETDIYMGLLNLETGEILIHSDSFNVTLQETLGFMINPVAFMVHIHEKQKLHQGIGSITTETGQTIPLKQELVTIYQRVIEAGGLPEQAMIKSPLMNILINGNHTQEPTTQSSKNAIE